MPIKTSGLQIDDPVVKEIIGEKELTILFLNKFLGEAQQELIKGYDMKISKLPDGRMILEPEGKELEVMQWVEQRLGQTALTDQINIFLKQREAQKDYDDLIEVGKELKELDENERKNIIENIKNKAKAAKEKNK